MKLLLGVFLLGGLALVTAPARAGAQITPDTLLVPRNCVGTVVFNERPADPYAHRSARLTAVAYSYDTESGAMCTDVYIDPSTFAAKRNGQNVTAYFTVDASLRYYVTATAVALPLPTNYYSSYSASAAVTLPDGYVDAVSTGTYYVQSTAAPCAPKVTFSTWPGSLTSATAAPYTAAYSMVDSNEGTDATCVGGSLTPSSFQFTLNGQNRTSSFGSPTADSARAASVALITGVVDTARATLSGQDSYNGVTTTGTAVALTTVNGSGAVAVNLTADAGRNGTTAERALCLDVSLADATAYECGDLRLAYALPTTRTMGTDRSPTLLYNSRQASAYRILHAAVTVPGTAAPDSITVAAFVSRVGTNPQSYPARTVGVYRGSDFTAGTARHIALSVDMRTDTTGVYAYQLVATTWRGSLTSTATSGGEMALVNRGCQGCSTIGAGWSLAGLERLVPIGGDRVLWVDGDGSTRVYTPDAVGSSTYHAPALTHPDSLQRTGSGWTRYAEHALKINFDVPGYHTSTVTRRNFTTTFLYDGTTGNPLSTIRLQTAGATSPEYRFVYVTQTGNAQHLSSVNVDAASGRPVQRTVTLSPRADGFVSSILGADARTVYYTPASGTSLLVTARGTGTNGIHTTSIHYDLAQSVDSAWTQLDSTGLRAANPKFRNEALLGLAAANHDVTVSRRADSLYTVVDGPRPDSVAIDRSTFWLSDLGSPVRIVNPDGDSTIVAYGDGRFPALATSIRHVNGLTDRVGYDAHGNLAADTLINPLGDGRNAVTSYAYDLRWDYVSDITRPELDTYHVTYDATNGERVSEQPGDSATRIVRYTHGAPFGMLDSVYTPASQKASGYHYDAMGNLDAMKSPLGYVQNIERDKIGQSVHGYSTVRDTMFDLRVREYTVDDSTYYDDLGRVTQAVSVAPGDSMTTYYSSGTMDQWKWGVKTVRVSTAFDTDGRVASVTRDGYLSSQKSANGAAPTVVRTTNALVTTYLRDYVGRTTQEIAPDGQSDRYAYDETGNVLQRTSRRGFVSTMTYDRQGRLLTRSTPSNSYSNETFAGLTEPYAISRVTGARLFPNGVTYSADVDRYTYDAAGNTLTASNDNSDVVRTYFTNGALKTETQSQVAVVSSAPPATRNHSFAIAYTYDLDGRRATMGHPTNLFVSYVATTKTTSYGYGAIGELRTLTSPYNEQYQFLYDAAGRLTKTTFPNGVLEKLQYDDESRLRSRLTDHAMCTKRTDTGVRDCIAGPCCFQTDSGYRYGIVVHDTLRYDTRGKLVYADDGALEHFEQYNPAGELVRDQQSYGPTYQSVNLTMLDAMGNRTTTVNRGSDAYAPIQAEDYEYNPVDGRLKWQRLWAVNTASYYLVAPAVYDLAGNTHFVQRDRPSIRCANTAPDCGGQTYPFVFGEVIASYFDAADHLRMVDRMVNSQAWGTEADALEEYRYDALGRRIMKRDRRGCYKPGNGVGSCIFEGHVERYVYDGDQILYEIRKSGKDSSSTASMESDGVGLDYYFDKYGVVLYTHGLALDHPLAARRIDGDNDPAFWAYLHSGWQGKAEVATTNGGANTSRIPLAFRKIIPGLSRAVISSNQSLDGGVWFGSLLDVQTDGSGQVYMRNRYYDPASGRFTQEDPIGLAGGLNAYGFAHGDPINYADPLGLWPWDKDAASFAAGIMRGIATITTIITQSTAPLLGPPAMGPVTPPTTTIPTLSVKIERINDFAKDAAKGTSNRAVAAGSPLPSASKALVGGDIAAAALGFAGKAVGVLVGIASSPTTMGDGSCDHNHCGSPSGTTKP